MFRIFAVFLTIGALLSTAVAQEAKDTRIGNVSLNLPPPVGYCELDRDRRPDASAIALVERMIGPSGNRLIQLSAECQQLKDWRADKRELLDHFSQYQTITEYENRAAPARPDEFIRSICAILRTRGDELKAKIQVETKALENLIDNLTFDETLFMGVVDEEPGVCYAALVQKLSSDLVKGRMSLGVYASLFIRGKLVLHYLFAPYAGEGTITESLAQLKAHMVRLRAANRN